MSRTAHERLYDALTDAGHNVAIWRDDPSLLRVYAADVGVEAPAEPEPLDPAVVAGEFGSRKDYERDSAATAVNKLARTLEGLLTALATGMQPAAGIGGDTDVVGQALEVQRRIDAWIFNARAEIAVGSCTSAL